MRHEPLLIHHAGPLRASRVRQLLEDAGESLFFHVARRNGIQEVTVSIPVGSTNKDGKGGLFGD
jgi:hypothetical protein